jgi:hypothetical protein
VGDAGPATIPLTPPAKLNLEACKSISDDLSSQSVGDCFVGCNQAGLVNSGFFEGRPPTLAPLSRRLSSWVVGNPVRFTRKSTLVSRVVAVAAASRAGDAISGAAARLGVRMLGTR